MKNGIKLFCFIIFLAISIAQINAKECDQLNSPKFGNFYLDYEQIILTEDGMFAIIENNVFRVYQITHDENGYACLVDYRKCPNDHPSVCLDCYGCRKKDCFYHCRCIGGPRQE